MELKRLSSRSATALLLIGSALAPLACSRPASSPFDVHFEENVMVPMRDGVHLATDVYRPAQGTDPALGQFPVVLFRIPYGKHRAVTAQQAKFFAQNGYVYLAQDTRGRYASEGIYHPFSEELAPDGYDAVSWATKQPWSNGKVATLGGSYGGLTQLALGITNPPGLSAQAIQWIWDNAFETGIYTGGAFNLRRIGWVVGQALVSQEAERDPVIRDALTKMNEDFLMWVDGFPRALRRGASPLALVPNYEEFLAGVIENNTYGPFWHRAGLNTEEHWDTYPDVPVYWLGGWYDIYASRTPLQYSEMSKRKQKPQKLLMGPWCHCATDITWVGGVEYGPPAAVNLDTVQLRWYDEILKDTDTGILNEPPVRIFVMGGGDGHRTEDDRIYHGGKWRDESEWPLTKTLYTPYYFHADGTMTADVPGPSEPTSYIHDPSNPVPTVGGAAAFQGSWPYWERVEVGPGGFDQRDLNGNLLRLRPDVVVFQTAPLPNDMELTGPITVKLFASSSMTDTDFTAKLIDVYPPSPDWPEGFEMNFHDGIIRASYRESVAQPTPLEPYKVYELTIEIPPVSNLFQQGHRIRIDIASSNYPRFDLNPGTLDAPWERRRLLKAENRIYHDAEHPSRVILPVIPN